MTSQEAVACIQGSPEWKQARCGFVTASRMSDVLATIKKGEAASRRNYKAELVGETLTGQAAEGYVSKEMRNGAPWTPKPFVYRAAYEFRADVMVEQVGFVVHPNIQRFGASPDGLVGPDGLVEIKCPNTATHLDWILANEVPSEHQWQMVAEMACTGRQWVDFVSFDPRLPQHLQLFVKRFSRKESEIVVVENEAQRMIADVDGILARLPKA